MINEVRNSVLSILNKNNYGYISPSDFNLFAANAQMEIYEEYYSSYNKVINAENTRASGTDYADVESPIAETLESFLMTDYLGHISRNIFSVPTLTTVGNESYYILKILCFPTTLTTGTNTDNSANELIDTNALFLSSGISEGDIVLNESSNNIAEVVSVDSDDTITLSNDLFPTGTGIDYSIFSSSYTKEADKVSIGKITMLNTSTLTKPSTLYPSYTLEGTSIKVYPSSINKKGQIQAVYFRYPKVPKWTYVNLPNGEPSFDQSQPDYQDFELPQEDGYKLVTKILEYCGMSIRESEVTQFGMAQQAHEQPTFSIQQ